MEFHEYGKSAEQGREVLVARVAGDLSRCLLDPARLCKQPSSDCGRIPIWSKLSELDLYIGKFYEKSSVEEWVPSRTAGSSDKPVKTKLGSLYVRHLGGYDSWTASATERESFTGEITFYHFSAVIPDDLAPSYVVSLVYVRGVLKQKDWGVMPG